MSPEQSLTVGSLPEDSTQGSYFRQLEVREHVTLLPCYLGRVGTGVIELLTSRILHYSEVYCGVLLAFSHVRVLQSSGRILDELPHIHIDVQYTATVFRPEKGDVMRGYVTKVGRDHVGCVLYGCFNASVTCSGDGGSGDWWSREFGEGEEVWFIVTKLDVTGSLLSLRGEYVNLWEVDKGEGGLRGGGEGRGEEEGGSELKKQVVADDVMRRGDAVAINGVRISEEVRSKRKRDKKKRKHKEEEEEGEVEGEGGGEEREVAMMERLGGVEGEGGSYGDKEVVKKRGRDGDGRQGVGGGGGGRGEKRRDKHRVKGGTSDGGGGEGVGGDSGEGEGVGGGGGGGGGKEEGKRKRKRHKDQCESVSSGGEKERKTKKRKLKL